MGRLAKRAMVPFLAALKTLVIWELFVVLCDSITPAILLWIGGAVWGKVAAITAGCVFSVIVGLLKTTRLTVLMLGDLMEGRAAAKEGRVSTSYDDKPAEGIARFHMDSEREKIYYFNPGKETFEVDEVSYSLLWNNYDYLRPVMKVYFAPRSKMMLALEQVHDPTL